MNKQQLATKIYCILMLLVFPLFVGFKGYGNLTFSKYLFFTISTAAWLVTLVILSVKDKTLGTSIRHPGKTGLCILAFMLISTVSAVFSPYGVSTLVGAGRFEGLITLILCGSIFLGVSLYGKPGKPELYAFGLSVIICCGVAIMQIFGKNPLSLFPTKYNYYDAHTYYTGEFLGTIGNTNLLSGYLCLAIALFTTAFILGNEKLDALYLIPACMGIFVLIYSKVAGGAVGIIVFFLIMPPMLLRSRRRIFRALLAMPALFVFIGFAIGLKPSYVSRTLSLSFRLGASGWSAMLIAIVFAILAVIISLRRECPAPNPKILSRGFAIVSAAFVLLGLVGIYSLPDEVSGTAYELSRVLHGDIQDEFGSSRVKIWRDTLSLVPERPLLGGGPDTLAKRLDLKFSRFIPETGKDKTTTVDNAHNEFLGYLVNIGILGLGAYLAAIVTSLVFWFRRRDEDGLRGAFAMSAVCYWVQSFFSLGLCIVLPLLWLVWGMGFTRAYDEDKKHPRSTEL